MIAARLMVSERKTKRYLLFDDSMRLVGDVYKRQGDGIFVLDGEEKHVKAGDTVVIPLEHYHAIKAITQLTFTAREGSGTLS